jgi:hypothetical protein
VTGANGASFSHIIGLLDKRLERIEIAIDRLADELDGKHEKLTDRLNSLEGTRSETRGGWTVLSAVGAIAGAVGGYATKWFGG